MKMFKLRIKTAIAGIFMLAVVFNSSAQTEITFAGQKYIKQKTDMKSNNGIITEFYPDGSIKSVSKDGVSVFQQDVNRNVGIGNGEHEPALHIYSGSGSVGLMPLGFNPSQKLIIKSDSTIHVEPKPIGNSKPMKRLNISTKYSLNSR